MNIWILSVIISLSILAIAIVPAFAAYNTSLGCPDCDNTKQIQLTSGGSLKVVLSTDPTNPNTTDQTQLRIIFMNKQNSTQQHIDYKVSITQGSNQIFGTPLTHTAPGSVSIPIQFQNFGTYQIIVEIDGILFQPIPPESATFSLQVGTGQNSYSQSPTPIPQTSLSMDLITVNNPIIQGDYVTANLINNQNTEQKFTFLVQCQDSSDAITGLSATSSSMFAGGRFTESQICGTNHDTRIAQIFILESLSKPVILSTPVSITSTTDTGVSSQNSGGNSITFSGNVNLPVTKNKVIVLVLGPNANLVQIAQAEVGNDGKFPINIKTNGLLSKQSGTYTIKVYNDGIPQNNLIFNYNATTGQVITGSTSTTGQNNVGNQNSQSTTSLDELLKQRLDAAQKLQKLLHPQNTTSSTSVSVGKNDVANISTKFGNIEILLNANTPETVANFEKLANSRFYDKTIFHRIIPGFVIQGGDPNTINGARSTWGLGDAGHTIPPEFSSSLNFTKYMVGMARGSDVNSGSSQFFITVGDAPWLNDQYTLFGEVISGKDVVDKIAALQTDPHTNQPVNAEDARIKTITISSNSQISPDVIKAIQQKQDDDKQKQLQLEQQIQLQKQEEDKQQQIQLQKQKLHDQKVDDETRKIISSRDEFYNANDDVHTLIFKGNAFLTTNRYVDAFNYYDKALSKDPKNSDALDGKNKAYDQIHQLVSKIVDIEDNTYNNNNPDSMASKGVLLAQLQDLDDSLSICNSALQLAPENYNAMGCKLAALSGLDRYDEMNKVLQNSTSSVADLQVLYRIFTLYHLGKYDDLEAYVNTLSNLASSGNSYSSFYGSSYGSYPYSSAALGFTVFKAAIAEKDGKTDLANSYYSIVIPSVGQDANTVKGSIFFLLKDYDKAIFYFDKAPYSQSVGYLKVITNDEIARQSAAYKIQHTIEHVQNSDENKHKFCFLFWCF